MIPTPRPVLLALLLASALFCVGCDDDDGTTGGMNATRSFDVTIENVGTPTPLLKSGAFTTPMGASQAGPLTPGDAYEMSFTAGPNEVPGNERDNTPIGQGAPVDVTDRVFLWDAGTEVDEELRTGPNQAPRQQGLNTGPDGEGSVARVTDTDGDDRPDNDGFSHAPTREGIRVTTAPR